MSTLSLPRAEQVPAGLRERVAEYVSMGQQLQAAQNELAALRGSTESARLADAQALADAARAGRDVSKVGTPAQDKLAGRIRQQETIVAGLSQAQEQIQAEVQDAMHRHAAAGIDMATAEAERLRGPYLAAIDAVTKAAAEYDATLYLLNGWLTYQESGGQRFGFGTSGSLNVRGAWIDPLNLAALTATLREHAGRLDRLLAALQPPPPEPTKLAKRTREQSFGEEDAQVWAA